MSFWKKLLNHSNPLSKDFWLWDSGKNWLDFFKGDKTFNDSFFGNGSVADDFSNAVGDMSNQLSGQYASADYADQIADENADVQFERQKEFMRMEHNLNSVGAKAHQLSSAGLNPILASGVSNTVSGASAQMSQPNSGSGDLSNIIGSLIGVAKVGAEIKELKARENEHNANAEAARASANERNASAKLINKEVDAFAERLKREEDSFAKDMQIKDENLENLRKANSLLDERIKNTKQERAQGWVQTITSAFSDIAMAIYFGVSAAKGVLIPIDKFKPIANNGDNGGASTKSVADILKDFGADFALSDDGQGMTLSMDGESFGASYDPTSGSIRMDSTSKGGLLGKVGSFILEQFME